MSLRCLLFVADEATADPIGQVLADLGVEVEYCPAAADAIAKVTQETFQIVIVDWDTHQEAILVLKTTRERKASQRPLTLAVVSEDSSVPQAMQAGANSILRKPVLVNQAKDTLKTALNLLRAKQTAAHAAVAGASAASSLVPSVVPATAPHNVPSSASSDHSSISGNETTLHAGEFLVSAPSPSGHFETESEIPLSGGQELVEPVDALAELETISAAVPKQKRPEPQPSEEKFSSAPLQPSASSSESDEPKGLQWYMKNRGVAAPAPASMSASSAPAPALAASAPAQPEVIGFDDMASDAPTSSYSEASAEPAPAKPSYAPTAKREQAKDDAELFAYVTGVGGDAKEKSEEESEKAPRAPIRLNGGMLLIAAALAICAIIAAPQAPWHAKVRVLWGRAHQALHAWINPQAVTTVAQAPAAHEDFARAGDEYKLPVAESIPDATTDPSQIKVTPVVDPTAKKPNTGADPNLAPADAGGTAGVPAQSPLQSPAAGQDGQAPSGQGSSAGQSGASQSNSGSGGAGSGGAGSGNSSPDAAAAGNQTTPAQPAGPQS